MGTINRGAIVVKPKQAFADWLRALPDPVPNVDLDRLRRECNVYLIPEWENAQELERVLAACCAEIFSEELWEWHTIEAAWPKKRTLAMFRDWFDVECVATVKDVATEPLFEEDF